MNETDHIAQPFTATISDNWKMDVNIHINIAHIFTEPRADI